MAYPKVMDVAGDEIETLRRTWWARKSSADRASVVAWLGKVEERIADDSHESTDIRMLLRIGVLGMLSLDAELADRGIDEIVGLVEMLESYQI